MSQNYFYPPAAGSGGGGGSSTSSVGLTSVQLVRNDYSSSNVTTSAYVQLVASMPDKANAIELFDSSGSTLVVAFGAPGLEVNKFYIPPGGSGQEPILVPAGTRVSIKAVDTNATTGELLMTFLK